MIIFYHTVSNALLYANEHTGEVLYEYRYSEGRRSPCVWNLAKWIDFIETTDCCFRISQEQADRFLKDGIEPKREDFIPEQPIEDEL